MPFAIAEPGLGLEATVHAAPSTLGTARRNQPAEIRNPEGRPFARRRPSFPPIAIGTLNED